LAAEAEALVFIVSGMVLSSLMGVLVSRGLPCPQCRPV